MDNEGVAGNENISGKILPGYFDAFRRRQSLIWECHTRPETQRFLSDGEQIREGVGGLETYDLRGLDSTCCDGFVDFSLEIGVFLWVLQQEVEDSPEGNCCCVAAGESVFI